METVKKHYDLLIDEGNDPVNDPIELKNYMDKWDGEKFINALALDKNKEVLEIGVGTGRIAIQVVTNCYKFTGIDLSLKTIERAKMHLSEYNINLINDDFLEYEFNKQFDIIYSSLTFMHFENKEVVFNKVYKLLKKDGRFVLSIDKKQETVIDYGTRCIKIYPSTKEDIQFLINKTKFKILEESETEFAWIFIIIK